MSGGEQGTHPYVGTHPTKPVVISNLGRPIVVAPGEVYEFLYNVSTRAGDRHLKGSQLTVVEKTTEFPHGEIGEAGHNWVCETQFGTSVWATLEQCIARDLFKRVVVEE